MRRITKATLGVVSLALWACGAPPAATTPIDPCAAPLGGPEWGGSTVPEAEPGFDALLETIPTNGLPASLATEHLDALTSALLAYALELPEEEITPALASSAPAPTLLGNAVLASFAVNGGASLDRSLLRRAVHRYYACDRGLPPTRTEFVAAFGDYTQFPQRTVTNSIPKQSNRVLFEDPDNGIYVAEDNGETEVILEGYRTDGALEFLAYDAGGRLVDRAELAMTTTPEVLPAPFTCAVCHRSMFSNKFDRVNPTQ